MATVQRVQARYVECRRGASETSSDVPIAKAPSYLPSSACRPMQQGAKSHADLRSSP
jgi:hypothetical protein